MKKKTDKRSCSIRSQKELSNMVTEKMLDHETFRFCSMTEDQLKTRIRKIKDPVKVEAVRTMASYLKVKPIVRVARKRRNELMAC